MLAISPIFVAILAEVYKCLVYEGCCGRNATDWIYLLVYPLFTVIMLALGNSHTVCKREAMYLRSLEVMYIVMFFKLSFNKSHLGFCCCSGSTSSESCHPWQWYLDP